MIPSFLRPLLRYFSWLLLALACAPCMAEGSVLSVKDATKRRSYLSMRISPDGKHISAIAQKGEATKVVLMDTDTLVPRFFESNRFNRMNNPTGTTWVSDEFLAIDSDDGADLLDLSGKHIMEIGSEYINNISPDSAGNARFLSFRRNGIYIARNTIKTGESEVVNFHMPGEPLSFVLDKDGVTRVARTISTAFLSDETTITVWYRADDKQPWEKLAMFPFNDEQWRAKEMGADGKSLLVLSNYRRDTLAYFRYDLETRKITEMMAGHPTQDVKALDEVANDKFNAVVTQGMKPSIEWFDPAWAALQLSVDTALPERINRLTGNPANKVLIYSYSDIDPGQWHLLDVPKSLLRKIASAKPEIDIGSMRPMQIVRYRARDGLGIPAYLTLPAKTDGAKPPAVILIHGGPVDRDGWEWNAEVQMLAARGYAVFQPQFRGSSGFGKAFTMAGYGQWGLSMQDDISDGVRWLSEQGYADPRRICIYGAGYGGYAAMWGLAKTPELFRCGASYSGVSDIGYMLKDNSILNARATGRLNRGILIGDAKNDKQKFEQVSPLRNAERITAPVLLAHGELDRLVPIEHSRKMLKALKENNKQVEWMMLEEERDWILHEKNQEKFYSALFDLLDRTIGPRAPR